MQGTRSLANKLTWAHNPKSYGLQNTLIQAEKLISTISKLEYATSSNPKADLEMDQCKQKLGAGQNRSKVVTLDLISRVQMRFKMKYSF